MLINTITNKLHNRTDTWLITGVAGFIGCNLLEALLKLNQKVVGLDNFATGYRHNLTHIREKVSPAQWTRFRFIEGDIRNVEDCQTACQGVQYVLHQAALGSVPRSLATPLVTNATNIDGFLNMLVAARDSQVLRFVYASSSSVYGDSPDLPKIEDRIGTPLSPYAVTKRVNEQYADVFAKVYDFKTIGLRYFNVFGPHQNHQGPYAAVIPTWATAMIMEQPVFINGDGSTSRDFCYVANAVQANLRAALTQNPAALNQVYNVAVGDSTSLGELFEAMKSCLVHRFPHLKDFQPTFRNFRAGDVQHSLADISKARALLGYEPTHNIHQGLAEAMKGYPGVLENAS